MRDDPQPSAPPIDLTQDVDSEEDDDDEELPMFELRAAVVGKQHYTGHMNEGEMVYLVREPRNPYDANAIKVMSLSNQQVGHIAAKDGTAGALAPIVDGKLAGGAGGSLEGRVVANSNHYKGEACVTVTALPLHKAAIAAHLLRRGMAFVDLSTGEYLGESVCRNAAAVPRPSKGSKLLHPANGASSGATYQRLNEAQVISELDRLWDECEAAQTSAGIALSDYPSLGRCLATRLLPHQIRGLAWMIDRETVAAKELPPFYELRNGKFHHSLTLHDYATAPRALAGGLLLDDMGLGKSLQTIALILSSSGRDFFPGAADALAQQPAPGVRSSTLIVAPLSVLSSWEEQFREHVLEGSLRILFYHGLNRSRDADFLAKHDVVVTTYDVLLGDFIGGGERDGGKKRKARQGPLHDVSWLRIVIDEGHVIRNMKTKRFKAVAALESTFRWVLTGTPIQNSVADLEALVQFLRLDPFYNSALFSRFISKPVKAGDPLGITKLRTLMKSISLKRLKLRVTEVHLLPKVEVQVQIPFSHPESEAYAAIQAAISDYVAYLTALGDEKLLANSSSILAFITRLRQCCLDSALIPAESLIRLLAFTKQKSAEGNPVARLSKEEQSALLEKFRAHFHAAGTGSPDVDEGSVLECCICLEFVRELGVMLRACKHMFCEPCVARLFEKSVGNVRCPLCRCPAKRSECISYAELKSAADENDGLGPVDETAVAVQSIRRHSSKTKEILNALAKIFGSQDTKDDKVVIFCSFVSYLSILAAALSSEGVAFASLTGSMTRVERARQLKSFSSDPSVRVILCSLKAAGVGITLTAGNHIFLTDLWWTPAVDSQAIDRVHRLGQQKQVVVYRFLMSNSIDERILTLQKQKSEQVLLTFERSAEEARRQRIRDFKVLLS